MKILPMKNSILALSLLTLAVTSACNRQDKTEDAAMPETTAADAAVAPATDATAMSATDANPNSAVAASAPDDSLALGLLVAVDDHEIQAAQQAASKDVSAPVLDYAHLMEKEHTDNLIASKALGGLADTAEVQAMKEKGASDLAAMGKLSGKEYETAYVDAMVKGHTEVLALIDGRLLSLASAGPVRDHFTQTRQHVAMHLEAAQKLQSSQ